MAHVTSSSCAEPHTDALVNVSSIAPATQLQSKLTDSVVCVWEANKIFHLRAVCSCGRLSLVT